MLRKLSKVLNSTKATTSNIDIPISLYLSHSRYKAPKHAIVLCHGLFGYDKRNLLFLQLKYWNGILEALESIGCKVFVSKVGATDSLKSRANSLREYLTMLSIQKGISNFNLVGHSMGGLDSRYMISHLPLEKFNVCSLTTIATPHRGSSFMDYLRDTTGLGSLQPCDVTLINSETKTQNSRKIHPVVKALFSPLDRSAFYNLTTEYCNAFNQISYDSPSTDYYSYAAVAKIPALDPLYFSHQIVQRNEGENDGFVSLNSAKWGNFRGIVDCDHWAIIPQKGIGRKSIITNGSFDIKDFYLSLVTKLANDGY